MTPEPKFKRKGSVNEDTLPFGWPAGPLSLRSEYSSCGRAVPDDDAQSLNDYVRQKQRNFLDRAERGEVLCKRRVARLFACQRSADRHAASQR